MENKPILWLRSEYKPNEARTPVTPQTAKQLTDNGYKVVVEQSNARAFSEQQFVDAGCTLTEEFSWPRAPDSSIIIGLKELPVNLGPFQHRHVHFAHVYKNQDGWETFLNQFNSGGGKLYDLEYLVDENGGRIAAFGYWAGFVGAAIAVLQWAAQQRNSTLGALKPWLSRNQLQQYVSKTVGAIGSKPEAMVIGAKGRCGVGAVELCERCGIQVTQWNREETNSGGPFDEILAHHVMINCVFLNSLIPPFITHAHLQNSARNSKRVLSVISDVSCDPFSDANPLPIYNNCTTMDKPSVRIVESDAADLVLDLISIDHLPTLLPVESSEEFATALLPYLLKIDQLETGVWQRAATVFKQKCADAQSGVKV